MKLFQYWTELPKNVSFLVSSDDDFISSSNKLLNMSQEIVQSEELINSVLEKSELLMSSENKFRILEKLSNIKAEKQSIASQSIRKSIKIMNQVLKSLEDNEVKSLDLPKIRMFLKLTRSIATNCDQEIRSNDRTVAASLISDNTTEINGLNFEAKFELFEMVKLFAEKAQSLLYLKSMELMKALRKESSPCFSRKSSNYSNCSTEDLCLNSKRFRDRKDTSLSLTSSNLSLSTIDSSSKISKKSSLSHVDTFELELTESF